MSAYIHFNYKLKMKPAVIVSLFIVGACFGLFPAADAQSTDSVQVTPEQQATEQLIVDRERQNQEMRQNRETERDMKALAREEKARAREAWQAEKLSRAQRKQAEQAEKARNNALKQTKKADKAEAKAQKARERADKQARKANRAIEKSRRY